MKLLFGVGSLLISLLVTAALSHASQIPVLSAVFRLPSAAYFLDESGREIHLQEGRNPPRPYVTLSVPASARRLPVSLVRWKGEWLMANDTDRLMRFDEKGHYLGEQPLPVPASSVAGAGNRLWIHSPVGAGSQQELWVSTDGGAFINVRLPERQLQKPLVAAAVASLAVMDARTNGAVTLVYLLGPPRVWRVDGHARVRFWPLAYVRSRERASLEDGGAPGSDVTLRSAPVRDLVEQQEGLFVLRNREDRKGAGGRYAEEKGLRIDRYGEDGRQLATGTYPEPVRWILRGDAREAMGLTADGRVLVAPMNDPIGGQVLD